MKLHIKKNLYSLEPATIIKGKKYLKLYANLLHATMKTINIDQI